MIIEGTGLYAGETADVQSLVPGVIAAAVVRTEAGQTRRVRTVDLRRPPRLRPTPAATSRPRPRPTGAPRADA